MKISTGLTYLAKYFMRAFAVILLAVLIYVKVMGITRCVVQGQSMFPTLEDKEKLLLAKKKTPDRFDMLVFDEGDSCLIKRVIGLPGDTIDVTEGKLTINGETVEEPYLDKALSREYRDSSFHVKVAEDSYYVLGDNRDNSVDSRDFGQVKKDQIIGVPIYRLDFRKGLEKR